MFLEIIYRSRNAAATLDDGEHSDRILAIWYLVKCYEANSNHPEALAACRDLEKLVAGLGGKGFGPMHPFGKKLEPRMEKLELTAGRGEQFFATASEASLLNNKKGARSTASESRPSN